MSSGLEAHGDKTLLNVTKLFNRRRELPKEIIVTLFDYFCAATVKTKEDLNIKVVISRSVRPLG